MRAAAGSIADQLRDGRSGRVVFVSHCLLNENVRFLGGATRAGAVAEAIEPYLRDGIGIVQLPCPEQAVWGGVLKHRMLAVYGRRVLRWWPARWVFVQATRSVTEFRYRRLARRAAADIAGYVAAGLQVVRVIGVGASPSCGVTTTLDLDGSVAAMAQCDRCALTAARVVERVVAANVTGGAGMFMTALRRDLDRRGIDVSWAEHDLLGELRARPYR